MNDKRILTALTITIYILCSASIQAAEPNDLSSYYGFGDMEVIKLDWGIMAISVLDINGDGRNDIIATNNLKSRIEILIQKENISPQEASVSVDPADTDINILEPPTRFEKQPFAVSQKMFSLVSGDFNSDGLKDLAYYGDPRGLYVLLQKAKEADDKSGGKLSWQTRKKIAIDDGLQTPYALVCGDLNNDGLDDIALAGRDVIYIVTQKKDGTLSEPVKYPSTTQIKAIDIADLNGDGVNDLIMIVSDVEKPYNVRFGLPGGQLGPQVHLTAEIPWAAELYDIDGSKAKEILAVDSISGRLMCYKLVNRIEKDSDWPVLFYPLASGQGSSDRDMVIGDVNGDKLADVVISDPASAEIILYKQTAEIGLSEPARFPSFADTVKLCAVDTDKDGKTEIAVLSIKEKAIGISKYEDNRLTFPKPLDVLGEPVAVDFGDIDADGFADCVYAAVDANQTRWLRTINNVGNLTKGKVKFTDKLLAKKEIELLGEIDRGLKLEKLKSNPDGIKILDADQDGLMDVLIFDRYNPPPMFARQTEKGIFELVDSAGAQSSLLKEATLSSIALGNIDDKKGDELLVAQKNFARSLVFSDKGIWTVVDQYNAKSRENNISALTLFEFAQDKQKTDNALLLLDSQRGRLQILKKGNDDTYRFDKEMDVGKWSNAKNLKMAQASLTGGKGRSLVIFDSEKFAIITPPGAGKTPVQLEQQFSYETKIKDGVYGQMTVGDINSDNRPDVIMVDYKGNHIEILALDSQYKPVPAMRFKLFEEKSYRDGKPSGKSTVEPRELKVADVTANGKNDLVIVIHDRIIIYPQD